MSEIKILNSPPLVPPNSTFENAASSTAIKTTTYLGGITVSTRVPVESTPTTSSFRLPTVTFNTGSFSNFLKAPAVPTSGSNIDLTFGIKAPTLPKGAIAAAVMNPSSLKKINVKEIGKSMGVPTTVKGALLKAFPLPPVGEALKTLGIPTNIQGIVKITGLQFPKFPEFPGLDQIGILLGAGPKWIAEQLAKYKTIVLPFVPGLTINMGMALAAVSVIRALLSTSPSELLKHLLSSIIDDLKTQVADEIQKAVDKVGNDFNQQLKGITDTAKVEFTKQHERANPPQTITDENGDTTTIPSSAPDLSGFLDTSNLPTPAPTEKIDIDSLRSSPPPGSELKSFSFSAQQSTRPNLTFASTVQTDNMVTISRSSTINPSIPTTSTNAMVRGVTVPSTNTTPPPGP